MENADLAGTLTRILEARPEVVAAYLFGSRARGEAGPRSDVDVAVLFDPPRPRTLLGLPVELEAELASAVGCPVDLIDLHRASPDLVHRVLRDGRLLLDRDPIARARFEVHARNAYFDLLPHLERIRAAR